MNEKEKLVLEVAAVAKEEGFEIALGYDALIDDASIVVDRLSRFEAYAEDMLTIIIPTCRENRTSTRLEGIRSRLNAIYFPGRLRNMTKTKEVITAPAPVEVAHRTLRNIWGHCDSAEQQQLAESLGHSLWSDFRRVFRREGKEEQIAEFIDDENRYTATSSIDKAAVVEAIEFLQNKNFDQTTPIAIDKIVDQLNTYLRRKAKVEPLPQLTRYFALATDSDTQRFTLDRVNIQTELILDDADCILPGLYPVIGPARSGKSRLLRKIPFLLFEPRQSSKMFNVCDAIYDFMSEPSRRVKVGTIPFSLRRLCDIFAIAYVSNRPVILLDSLQGLLDESNTIAEGGALAGGFNTAYIRALRVIEAMTEALGLYVFAAVNSFSATEQHEIRKFEALHIGVTAGTASPLTNSITVRDYGPIRKDISVSGLLNALDSVEELLPKF